MKVDYVWIAGGGLGMLVGLFLGLGYRDPLFGVAVALSWAVILGGESFESVSITGNSISRWGLRFVFPLFVVGLAYTSPLLADVPTIPLVLLLFGLWGGGEWVGRCLERGTRGGDTDVAG